MKWKWITLIFILENVYALDSPNNHWKQPEPSNPAINSNKNVNKARHKNSKITSFAPNPIIDTEVITTGTEPYFPDVIYPTSILEAAQPFYYSQAVNDEVLGPFSNDVKSFYKSLRSGKDKTITNGSASKHLDRVSEKVSPSLTIDYEKQVLYNEITENINIDDLHDNLTYSQEDLEKTSNKEPEEEQTLSQITLNKSDFLDIELLEGNVTITSNETFSKVKKNLCTEIEDVEMENSSNQTHYVTPNYVVTSATGNSHEDFISDIMNIYSLIEETIRAISVVEFVVSKTLGTLGLEDKQTEPLANGNMKNSSFTYEDNSTMVYDYDFNIVDNCTTNNSNIPFETFAEVNNFEPAAITSDILAYKYLCSAEEAPSCF